MVALCTTSTTALARVKKNKVLVGSVLSAKLSKPKAK